MSDTFVYDRTKFHAFRHFFVPANDDFLDNLFKPILLKTPPAFVHLAGSFKKNCASIINTASMPFKISSANYSHRLFHQYWTGERILAMKPEFDDKAEEERDKMAADLARRRFSEAMASDARRYEGGLEILSDLEHLLIDPDMVLAAAELMRQCEALTWGTLEVLANDLFIALLNARPAFTERLLEDERTRKRFQLRDLASSLSTYSYDLSNHMGEVLSALVKIDDVDTMRIVFDVLFPSNQELMTLIGGSELWKLNQRRNLILHRRSIVDDLYIKNTGDLSAIGSELIIPPKQVQDQLELIVQIGSAMLGSMPQ